MKKHDLIILAGGEKGPLFETTGYLRKAMLPIHGKPMLDWVVDAYRMVPAIDNIVVVGDSDLDVLASMRHVRKRIPTGVNLLQNLMHGVGYIKHSVRQGAAKHNGYMISFCDAVFLTPEIIQDALNRIDRSDADVGLHYVEKESFVEAGLPAKRTYIPIAGKNYTGSVLYYLRSFSLIAGFLSELLEMRKTRKDPRGLLHVLGCEGKNFQEIEGVLSEKVSARVRIFTSPHPGMGMDVDKPADLELAESTLESPWRGRYERSAIIHNPAAGLGKTLPRAIAKILGLPQRKGDDPSRKAHLAEDVRDTLRKYGLDPEIHETTRQGEATEIARRCAEHQLDLVVAVGGDGTINEVVNGLVGSKTVLGAIPSGTGNVFALQMKLPVEIEAACQVIASGHTTAIDLGRVGERHFACMAGVGFDAQVLMEADRGLKRTLGAAAYIWVAISRFFTYKFNQIEVRIDDQPISRKGYFVIIGNGRYYAGENIFASQADMTDGLLDVCIFKHKNLFSVLSYLFGMWRKDLDSYMTVEYFQCRELSVLEGADSLIHVDGEQQGRTPAQIGVRPQAIRVAI